MKQWSLALCLALALVLTACAGGDSSQNSSAQSPSDAGDTRQSDSGAQEAAGLLSSFSTTDLEGNAVDQSILEDYDLTMVNVWATYCTPCLQEMPDLGELASEYEDKGVQILGLVSDVLNSDGTISSSTGSVADAQHNQLINDVNSGLAYFADNGAIVYKKAEETETDPEQPGTDPSVDPGGTGEENPAVPGTDPGSDGGETAPDPSVPGTEPQNPGPDGADPGDSSADPVSPEDGNGSTEQSGSEPSTTGSETASGGEGVTAPEQDSAQNEENGAL